MISFVFFSLHVFIKTQFLKFKIENKSGNVEENKESCGWYVGVHQECAIAGNVQ